MVNRNDALVSATIVGGQIVYTRKAELSARVQAPSCKRDAFWKPPLAREINSAVSAIASWRGFSIQEGIFSEASNHRCLVACEMHGVSS